MQISAKIFVYKPWRPKGFFNFKSSELYVFVSYFRFIWILMLWDYCHYTLSVRRLTLYIRFWACIFICIIIFYSFGQSNQGSFLICSAGVVYICGLTHQVRIGRWTTWHGCETSFRSLGPDVISLNSIRLTTRIMSQSYLCMITTSTSDVDSSTRPPDFVPEIFLRGYTRHKQAKDRS